VFEKNETYDSEDEDSNLSYSNDDDNGERLNSEPN